jgi:hypothetical protein
MNRHTHLLGQLTRFALGATLFLLATSCTGTVADPGYSVIADVNIDADSLSPDLLNSEVVMEVYSDWPDVRTPLRIGKLCAATGAHTFLWEFVDLGCPTEATLVAVIYPTEGTTEECLALPEKGEPAQASYSGVIPRAETVVFAGQTPNQECEGPNEEHVVLDLP